MKNFKKKNLEFISASKRKTNRASFCLSWQRILLLLPVVTMCLFLCMFGYLMWNAAEAKTEAEKILLKLEATQESQEITRKQRSDEVYYYRFMEEFKKAEMMILEIPKVSSDTIALIYGEAGSEVEVESLSYEAGHFEIIAITKDYKEASKYAIRLDNAGVFEEIQYKGFSVEREEDENPNYRFTVIAASKGGETP